VRGLPAVNWSSTLSFARTLSEPEKGSQDAAKPPRALD
jgi:hypothetical protein